MICVQTIHKVFLQKLAGSALLAPVSVWNVHIFKP